jgi:DNA-directed RNA polymerase II subunit RPB1
MSYDSFNNNEDIYPIDRIEFTVFGNKEIKQYSIVGKDTFGINLAETYDNNEPIKNGVVDPRLGTTDLNRDCETCGLNHAECPGHFGHTELCEPVFHNGFLVIVKDILSCICIRCSKLLINKEDKHLENLLKIKYNKSRFNEIKKLTSNVSYCQRADYNCGAPVPKIKKETKKTGLIQLVAEFQIGQQKTETSEVSELDDSKKKIKEILYPSQVFNILRNISDSDCKLMGLNPFKMRPEDLIIKNFPIPTIAIRPSIKADYLSSGSAEDDLTKKIADIIKQNLRIRKHKDKEALGEETKFLDGHLQLLQYHIAAYFNNESVTLPRSEQKTGGKPIISISQRIQGKTGRIRNNLEGKRTNFCARTVITSDPNIGLDELGVPIYIAMKLTFPEIVTPYNINKLTQIVRNGRDKYPGANYVWPKSSGNEKRYPIDLRYRKRTVKLHYGDIVERHIINGDPVLFNRQPTLHKMSMMCHKIKIIPNDKLSTFRLNVSVTQPYNADFDGDEMNLFLPQSIQTQLELSMIADVKKQIISPCFSTPIIKFKQDTLAGLFLMTENKKEMDWRDAMNYSMYLYDYEQTKIEKGKINTHQLMSKIIPPIINYKENKIEINNGELIEGSITSKTLSNKIIPFIWDRYGAQTTKTFIDNAQRLACVYLMDRGFTVGFRDAIAPTELKQDMLKNVYEKEIQALQLLTEIENNPNLLDPETFETSLFSNLQTVKSDIALKTFKKLDSTNNFFTMVESGAKGNDINISEIIMAKGQDILKYARIDKTVNNRTLPHLFQNDDTPKGRGYITNSYYEGLDPLEFWFHHQAGREGLINTAVKTAETGYQQRKMIKAMEDIMVTYDGTVRTGNNILLQMVYGDNHLDQTLQKKIKLNIINMGNSDIENKYLFTQQEINEMIKNENISRLDLNKFNELNNNFCKELKNMRDTLRKIQIKSLINYITLDDIFYQPINYSRIILDIINIGNNDEEPLTPFYIIEKINFILLHENTPLMYYKNDLKSPLKADNEIKYKFIFKIALYEYIGPKRCIYEYKLNKSKFDLLVKEIIDSFKKNLVEPGEMVGIVAAQSIGEPLTQMTLSSFHKTGAGVAGIQGTPRIRELLGYTKNIQTPYMLIYMDEKYKNDKVIVNKVASNLRYTIMKDIIKNLDIIYDPNNIYTDKDQLDNKSIFYISSKSSNDLGSMPWLYRIFLSREALLDYDIAMLDIKAKFIQFWTDKFSDLSILKKNYKDLITKIINGCIITNFNNSDIPMVHIRFELSNINNKTLIEIQEILINKFNLKGDELITKIDKIENQSCLSFDNEDSQIQKKSEYVIYTFGINFEKIRNIPFIDQNRTICNDLYTTYCLYGIEGARSLLIKEINSVFSHGGSNINYHHISLITDLMTNTGVITSIDRHGINRLETDPLVRASFEKTIEVLINAAVFNETDLMRSVSSRIMAGKVFRGGTGLCEVLIDNNILENSEFDEYKVEKHESSKEFIQLTSSDLISDLLNKQDLDIYIPK